MGQNSKSNRSETGQNMKLIATISLAAIFGILLSYGSTLFFGYKITLIWMVIVTFVGLALESTIIDALVPAIMLGGAGYAALIFFPKLIPLGGIFCGLAIIMGYATKREEKERNKIKSEK